MRGHRDGELIDPEQGDLLVSAAYDLGANDHIQTFDTVNPGASTSATSASAQTATATATVADQQGASNLRKRVQDQHQHQQRQHGGEWYRAVTLHVSSNYGAPEYTCLYRLRVHGTPQSEQQAIL